MSTTLQRTARLAGALYLAQMASGVAGFAIRSNLIVRGDAGRTAQNVLASERLFRLSILADLGVVVLVIALTWTLYVLLESINRNVMLLSALFRIVENAVLAAVTVNLVTALAILKNAEYLKAFDSAQVSALGRLLLSANAQGYTIAFILTGLGTLAFSSVLFQSRYVPRWVAGWGVVASLLFAACAAATLVFPEAGQELQMISWPPMGIFEVGLGLWLLIRGVTHSAESPAG